MERVNYRFGWVCIPIFIVCFSFVLTRSVCGVNFLSKVGTFAKGVKSSAEGGGWMSSIKQAATTMGKGTLTTINNLKPLGSFLVRFPVNFMRAIKTTKYSSRRFAVYQSLESRKAHEESLEGGEFDGVSGREFGDDASYGYRLEYDFGFDGSGDINQPLGFRLVDGKYYYRPVKGRLVPSTMTLQGNKTPLDLTSSKCTTPQCYLFRHFMNKSLSFLMGGVEKAKSMLKNMSGVLKLKPEHIFFIKAMTLVSDASRNSVSRSGYPRYGHIPTELTLLFSRLAQTPDIKKCLILNKGAKYPSQWENVQMIDVSEVMNKAFFPGALRELANAVKMPVEEREIQEMRDRKSKPLSDMQRSYSQMRGMFNYNNRTSFGMSTILEIDHNALNKTDKDLYVYTIRRHIADRFKGLKTRVVQYAGAYVFGGEEEGDVLGEAQPEEVSLEEFADEISQSPAPKTHIGNLTGMIKNRIPPLKDFIAKAIGRFREYGVDSSEVQILRDIESKVDFQVKKLEDLGGAASVAEVDEDEEKARDIAQELERYLTSLEEQELVELSLGQSTRRVLLKFPDYLKLRCYQFEKVFFNRFRGDTGYMFDDAYLSQKAAVAHALAIFIRAARDQAKAIDLLKKDTNSYTMNDKDGNEIQIVGAALYREKLAKAEQYLMSSENSLARAQKQATQGSLTSDLGGLFGSAEKATQVYKSYKNEFAHYARQYQFDRRNLKPLGFMQDKLSAAIPTSKEDMVAKLKGFLAEKWSVEKVRWETFKIRMAEQVGEMKIKVRAEQRAFKLATSGETAQLVAIIREPDLSDFQIQVDGMRAQFKLLSFLTYASEVKTMLTALSGEELISTVAKRQKSAQELLDSLNLLEERVIIGKSAFEQQDLSVASSFEVERRRQELDNLMNALDRADDSLDIMSSSVEKLVEDLGIIEIVSVSAISDEVEPIISVVEEELPYARTVNDFMGEELAFLMLRSKDFEKTCRLYLDPFLKEAMGISIDNLMEMAAAKREQVIGSLDARFESDFGNILEEDLGALEADIARELAAGGTQVGEFTTSVQEETGTVVTSAASFVTLAAESGIESTAEAWDGYTVDLPGETGDQRDYVSYGDVRLVVDIPAEPIPALMDDVDEDVAGEVEGIVRTVLAPVASVSTIVEAAPVITSTTSVLSRDAAQLLEARTISRVTSPVVSPVSVPVVESAPIAPTADVRTTYGSFVPEGAAR